MDCREFCRIHSALLDETLSEQDASSAHLHMVTCARCAEHHTSVRRAVLVFRNISCIEPSRHFSERLNLRLAQARILGPERVVPTWSGMGIAGVTAGALFAVAFMASLAVPRSDLAFPPMVVAGPTVQAPHFVAPTIARASSRHAPGWSEWSDVLFLEHASAEPGDPEFHFAGFTGR